MSGWDVFEVAAGTFFVLARGRLARFQMATYDRHAEMREPAFRIRPRAREERIFTFMYLSVGLLFVVAGISSLVSH